MFLGYRVVAQPVNHAPVPVSEWTTKESALDILKSLMPQGFFGTTYAVQSRRGVLTYL